MFWFWGFVGPAGLLAVLALRGERRRAEYVASYMTALDEPAKDPPPVTLIVPILEEAADLAGALAAFAAQDYPDFELIVVARSVEAIPAGTLPTAVKVTIAPVSGEAALLEAGIRAAQRKSKIFAFGAPDGRVSTRWLHALVAPLHEPDVGASTGFRWYTPEPPSFWPLMRSVWNGVMAGRLGAGTNEFAWRGAIAITREAFAWACVEERWRRGGRCDLALAAAVRESGLRVAFAPGAMVDYSGTTTMLEFLQQARREMVSVCRQTPRLWWTALLSHAIYCGAMLVTVVSILRGSRGAEWALVILFGLGMLKGANRATLAKAQLPGYRAWFERYGWTHTFWVPLATWIWLCVLIGSAFGSSDLKE